MVAPSIYQYLNYRSYVADWFEAKRQSDPTFSRRSFSRLVGNSEPGLLTQIVNGRRIRPKLVRPVSRALGLSRREADFFQALVQLDQASSDEDRNHAWKRISSTPAFREARPLDAASFRYLSRWWYPVVKELAQRRDFRPDPAWIARRLRPSITEAQARDALETLTRLGLLVVDDDGSTAPADAVVATPHEVQGLAVHNYHKGMLERASEAIDRFEPEHRHFLASTASISHAALPELKEAMNAFQEQIAEICARYEGDADEVVQINLHLFPLSDRAPEDDP